MKEQQQLDGNSTALPQQRGKSGFFGPALLPSTQITPSSNSVLQLQQQHTLPVVGSTPLSDTDFKLIMDVKYGVTNIKTGTQGEQESQLSRHNLPPAVIPNWQSWDPGSSSIVYNHIIQAFEAFEQRLGATPVVNSITFFDVHYDRDATTGAISPNSDVGASFGLRDMVIYRAITTLDHAIPYARSTTGSYVNPPTISVSAPGSSPGAPMPLPSRGESIIRMITHELGHGAQAAAMNLPNAASASDPNMLRDYATNVGWTNDSPPKLFDIGVPAVANAFLAGTTPPSQYEITSSNWNHPQWVEQPVSAYSVSGGVGEDFAEAIMLFVTNPALLQSRSPSRYQFINARRGRWIMNMHLVPQPPPEPGDYPIRTLPPGHEYA